jgi:putative FmdB family regulatory protein
MPIYEYRCEACGHTFETLQKVSDSPLVRCPACGKDALKKLVSVSAFRLKGGGWYETDFKTGTRKNVAGGDKDKGDKDKKAGSGDTAAKTKDATSTPKK